MWLKPSSTHLISALKRSKCPFASLISPLVVSRTSSGNCLPLQPHHCIWWLLWWHAGCLDAHQVPTHHHRSRGCQRPTGCVLWSARLQPIKVLGGEEAATTKLHTMHFVTTLRGQAGLTRLAWSLVAGEGSCLCTACMELCFLHSRLLLLPHHLDVCACRCACRCTCRCSIVPLAGTLQVVTFDASAAAGAAPACAGNVRAAFKALFGLGRSAVGRGQLQELFRLCDALDGEEDVKTLAYWAQVCDVYLPHLLCTAWLCMHHACYVHV